MRNLETSFKEIITSKIIHESRLDIKNFIKYNIVSKRILLSI